LKVEILHVVVLYVVFVSCN